MPRLGRPNPGREHISGADVTARMQRQYEHILQSLRDYHRYGSDAKRKQVAASTVRKLAEQNRGIVTKALQSIGIPTDDRSRAELLAEEFHGRPVRQELEVTEREVYDDEFAILGYLEELNILTEDGDYVIPISFGYDKTGGAGNVQVVSADGKNIEFIGGDQWIDWGRVEGAHSIEDKNLIYVGPVLSIAYWTDKHHLSGPKYQREGTSYEHEFGEDNGELPYLFYDRRNRKLMLASGAYSIESEGIAG